MNDTRIYKIAGRQEWEAAVKLGSYTGSADDTRDGFIHFSRASQLHATAAKYFAGRSDVVLIAVDATALGDALRYEASRGGDLFPHLYGPLPVDSARGVWPLPWDGSKHAFPQNLPV